MDTTIDKLERLAALHRAGSLSDAEYAAEKAKVLDAPATPEPVFNAAHNPSPERPLSATWQRRFAFFRENGSPFSAEGAKALQRLPFWTASSIRMNIWGVLFGPFYFYFLGLWKRGTALLVLAIAISLLMDKLLGESISRAAGFGMAVVFGMLVNYARYIKVTQGRDDWNPFADLTSTSAAAAPRP